MLKVTNRLFFAQKIKKYPDFGVNAVILDTINISQRGQVNLRYFPERIDAMRQYFYFLYRFLGIISRKRFGQLFKIMIWIYYYLLNGIISDLDLDNSC